MDGIAVIREARQLNTELPVIVIAGCSTEATAAANLRVFGDLARAFELPHILTAAANSLNQ